MALEKELETFYAKLPELLAHEGHFALVHDNDPIVAFDTYEDAIKAGYLRFGLQPFLVKQISVNEQANFISRLVVPDSAVTVP